MVQETTARNTARRLPGSGGGWGRGVSLYSHRRWLALIFLLWCFGALMYNAGAQSPTMDEQNHIARGYAFLRTGDPRLSIEHPPLINSLEALPLLMVPNIQLPTDDWSWEVSEWYRFAELLLWQRQNPVDQMVFLARLPVVAMTLLLAALVSRWARELWGPPAGILALALITIDPNFLAHGKLATTDVGMTFMVLLAGYTTWRLGRSPDRRWWLYGLWGLTLGTMLASKISTLAFLGIFVGLLLLWLCLDTVRNGEWRATLIQGGALCLSVILAFAVLWASYGFQVVPAVENGPPVPAGTYWHGVLSMFQQVQGGRASYFMGRTMLQGSLTYFPVTFAIKTPLATLSLLLLAIPSMVKRKSWGTQAFLLIPILVYWFVAVQSALNIGYRHLLPTLPFLYVWAAQSTVPFARLTPHASRLTFHSLFLLALAFECLWITPHYLSYFNILGGGPQNGWRIVADSNIDWGQDLKGLKDYMTTHNTGPVKLSWFGSSYPEYYGIAYEPLPGLPHHFDLWTAPPFDPQQPEPGIYAISVSNLVEIPFEDKHVFAYFREREPDARIGYSIYIYNIPSREDP